MTKMNNQNEEEFTSFEPTEVDEDDEVAEDESSAGTANDIVDYYLKARAFNGLFSQIELFSASNL
ncbi:hypothetical protein AALP_AA8G496400 [Arabis alpina]|uniref:Uncharacterized protein n=1 Tax=Arabis alpina TaxID=50452 RepID=A0A087GEI1_ARAAL|nr:hypothetical protein AALP_AA8G496400 [Arabis alpina]